jgi:hypothetical protein
MNASAESPQIAAPARQLSDPVVVAGLAGFALYHLALALFMAFAPHAFYETIGPFDAYNSHYIRDTATFEAALGVGFVVAVRVPSWRVPVLAITMVQFALHTINHLIDADVADPTWVGWFDFAALAISTLLLARLLVLARAEAPPPPPTQGALR